MCKEAWYEPVGNRNVGGMRASRFEQLEQDVRVRAVGTAAGLPRGMRL